MEIIVIVFILGFCLVISLILVGMGNTDGRRQQATLLHQFSKVGSKYGLSFTSQEVLPHRFIGLDGIRQTLLVFEITDNDFDWYLIHLKNVSACTLKMIYGNVGANFSSGHSIDSALDMIALEFSFKDGKQTVALPFYLQLQNRGEAIPELSQKAKNWQVMLSKLLTKESKRA